MRKLRFIFILLLVLVLVSCAELQKKWNALTPDEKARVIINDLQDQLTDAFDTGKAYVVANPKYQDRWKNEIVPAFDLANKSLASVVKMGQSQTLTPALVYKEVQGAVTNVMSLLIEIGAKKKGG